MIDSKVIRSGLRAEEGSNRIKENASSNGKHY